MYITSPWQYSIKKNSHWNSLSSWLLINKLEKVESGTEIVKEEMITPKKPKDRIFSTIRCSSVSKNPVITDILVDVWKFSNAKCTEETRSTVKAQGGDKLTQLFSFLPWACLYVSP